MSTPTIPNRLLPGCRGTVMLKPVTLVQVTGYSIPLISTVFTFTGAVPVITAVLFTTTGAFRLKLLAFSAASGDAMLVRADVSQLLMFAFGFSTLWPLATNVLYLASNKGPLFAVLSGPFTNSCSARQYIRRK